MASPYTGTRTHHATIQIVDDGDPKNAASVDVPLEQLKDCVERLKIVHATYSADANGTITANAAHTIVQVGAGGPATFTADRTLSVNATGALAGDILDVFLHPDEDTFGVDVLGVYLNNTDVSGGSPPRGAQASSARFVRGSDASWILIGLGGAGTGFSAQLGAGTLVWKCPPDVTFVDVYACGAGGGGGGGAGGNTGNILHGGGGGGGGGAGLARTQRIAVVAGQVYELVTQAGGTAGVAGAVDAYGTSGAAGDQTIFRVQGGATLARWSGGQGGERGVLSTGTDGYAGGGGPMGVDPSVPSAQVSPNRRTAANGWPTSHGFGGLGYRPANTSTVAPTTAPGDSYGVSLDGCPGGARGNFGTITGSGGSAAGSGGYGGGGAASGFQWAGVAYAGGNGGNGGNGKKNPDPSTSGTAGAAGGYGCGGGGGGGGGGNDQSGSLVGGSAGGAGGAGAGVINWARGG